MNFTWDSFSSMLLLQKAVLVLMVSPQTLAVCSALIVDCFDLPTVSHHAYGGV